MLKINVEELIETAKAVEAKKVLKEAEAKPLEKDLELDTYLTMDQLEKGKVYIFEDRYNPSKSWEVRKTYSGAFFVGQRIDGKIFNVCGKCYQRKTRKSIEQLKYTEGRVLRIGEITAKVNLVNLNGKEFHVLDKCGDTYLLEGWSFKFPFVIAKGVDLEAGTWETGDFFENSRLAYQIYKEGLLAKRVTNSKIARSRRMVMNQGGIR